MLIKSTVIFEYNSVHDDGVGGHGGAIYIKNGILNIDKDACVRFSHNSVGTTGLGGAVLLHNATLFLLSYMKPLHTVIDTTSVAVITQYP